MHFIPKFPLHLNSITLLGLTLLLGLMGGEIAKRLRFLPQISGYIAIGFLIGSGGFNIVNQTVLANAHIFVDISLSLILFELGRHLDFSWIRHDFGIMYMSLAESSVTFTLIFCLLHFLAGMHMLSSALAATIAIATSPAVVMMVAYDLSAEGPVTRRSLMLTSLNNLYALIIFIILAPLAQSGTLINYDLITFIAYRLFGSILLGLAIFLLIKFIAHLTGKHKENQFVLFVGAVIFAIGFAHTLKLSSMLTLFSLGVAARNLDRQHTLMEINFGWLARLFFILLFVVTGVHLQLQGLWQATWIVLLFIFARIAAKITGVLLFSKSSRLTTRQSVALSFTLLPMAGVAIGMSNILVDFNPDFDYRLLIIITAVVAMLNIIGPIATQLAFIMTGESLLQQNRAGN
jgi:Kef-type K+ transport system membrane component KefB